MEKLNLVIGLIMSEIIKCESIFLHILGKYFSAFSSSPSQLIQAIYVQAQYKITKEIQVIWYAANSTF